MSQMKKKRNHTDEFESVLDIVAEELHPFISEHHHTYHLMDKVREKYSKELYQKALNEIEKELEHHFRYEETLILPRLSRYFSRQEVGPGVKLIDEHDSIRKKFQEVTELFKENTSENEKLVKEMNLLAYLIKKHIEKEDHYFFPMVSLILSLKEKEEIAYALNQEKIKGTR